LQSIHLLLSFYTSQLRHNEWQFEL